MYYIYMHIYIYVMCTHTHPHVSRIQLMCLRAHSANWLTGAEAPYGRFPKFHSVFRIEIPKSCFPKIRISTLKLKFRRLKLWKPTVSEQPSHWRKSSKRESCYGDRVYNFTNITIIITIIVIIVIIVMETGCRVGKAPQGDERGATGSMVDFQNFIVFFGAETLVH